MLKTLTIENYALIEHLNINFNAGFSVITGETGAGKSILLGALGLILGNRADTSVLKNKEKKCIVEGQFNIAEFGLKSFFDKEELDYFDECMLRREISPQGRSRAFINDIPVSLTQMKTLSKQLTDIHSQNQNPELRNRKYQLYTLDIFAENKKLLQTYKSLYQDFKNKEKKLSELLAKAEAEKSDRDYWQYRFDELEKANLQADEQNQLEKDFQLIENSADIKLAYESAFQNLSENDFSAIQKIIAASDFLNKIKKILPEAAQYRERLESCKIELQDIASELETKAEDIEYNPDEAQAVNDRLNLIYELQKKHKVETIEELLSIKQKLFEKISDIESYDEQIINLEKELNNLKTQANNKATELHKTRTKAAKNFEKEIQKLLKRLGMPNAVFDIQISDNETLNEMGKDQVEFLFSANKNAPPADIAKIASGGEISRLMLSLKAIIANSVKLPTIIFDEIDTGISGDIADKAGNIMKQMSANMQVIDITHLPQIAAKADNQYIVYKTENKNSTHTKVKKLNKQERISEIAKMLSGENISEAAIKNAQALLENNSQL